MGASKQGDFRGVNITAMGSDQPRPEEVVGEKILGRINAPSAHHRLHLVGALGQVDGVANVMGFRHFPAAAQQSWGTGLRRMGRHETGNPAVLLAVPLLDQVSAAL